MWVGGGGLVGLVMVNGFVFFLFCENGLESLGSL